MSNKINNLIGKEVKIYPGDTYLKHGIIEDISPAGVLFKITKVDERASSYTVDSLHFIAYSANLSFKVIS